MAVVTVPLPKKTMGAHVFVKPYQKYSSVFWSYLIKQNMIGILENETQWICPPNVLYPPSCAFAFRGELGTKNLRCFSVLHKNHSRLYNNTFEWQALANLGGDALMWPCKNYFSHPSFGY